MTRDEAHARIEEIVEKAAGIDADVLTAAWIKNSRDLWFAVEHLAPDHALTLICEFGYLQGLSAALYLYGTGPLGSSETYEDFLKCWHIIIQDFIAEAERKHYGID